jgi:hypothetical protein
MGSLGAKITLPIAIALAVVLTPALAGCAGGIPGPVQGIIKEATGGNVDLGGEGLPQEFPAAEVPLYEGDIVFGAGLGSGSEKVFNVTVSVQDAGAVDQISSQLAAAGFEATAEASLSSDQGGTLIYTSEAWGVLVVVAADGDGAWTANYTVTPVSSSK